MHDASHRKISKHGQSLNHVPHCCSMVSPQTITALWRILHVMMCSRPICSAVGAEGTFGGGRCVGVTCRFSLISCISLAPRSPLLLDGLASGPRHLLWVASYHDMLAPPCDRRSTPRAPSEASGSAASLGEYLWVSHPSAPHPHHVPHCCSTAWPLGLAIFCG